MPANRRKKPLTGFFGKASPTRSAEVIGRELVEVNSLETLARVLLGGYGYDESPGVPRHVYLSADQEGPYRWAFAHLLRSGFLFSSELRSLLADLIFEAEHPVDREIVFRFKRKGKRRDHSYNSAIATTVFKHVQKGESLESGIRDAMKIFGLERRHVQRVWGSYRQVLELVYNVKP